MLPTRPPQLLQWFYPSLVWKGPAKEDAVYLTFDDGPHPTLTSWVLDELDKFDFKATFFCIGDNVRKYPETYREILRRGHRTGNHTFNHLKGFQTDTKEYLGNVEACSQLVESDLLRPPYGQIKTSQIRSLKAKYKIVMWSLLAEDWNPKLDPEIKLSALKALTLSGDIIVFHDSEKAMANLEYLLPKYLEFLKEKRFNPALL